MFEKREALSFDVEGQKIFSIRHKPLQKKASATVLFLHGFGGNKVGKYAIATEMAVRLAKVGIESLRFDFRGSGDSEGEFKDTTIQSQLEDAIAVYDALGKKEVAVIGTSLGGLIASLLCQERPIKALGLWAPVFDGHQWQGAKLPEGLTYLMHKERLVTSQFFKELFAISPEKIGQAIVNVPLLCIAGGQDETLDRTHFDKYKEASPQGIFHFLENADHSFTKYEDREFVLEKTLSWLQEKLCN